MMEDNAHIHTDQINLDVERRRTVAFSPLVLLLLWKARRV